MTSITVETTVGDLVRSSPARSRIFESLGIDYCCGGKKPLAEVCRARDLDPATVVAMLSAIDSVADASAGADADAMSLSALCDHIESAHHDYLREELPRLDFMTRKVAAVHGDGEPRLVEIRRIFERLAPELAAHITGEEKEVFPVIRALEAGTGAGAAALASSLAELEQEHDAAGAALAQFRELTDGYRPPEWACNTFRALYDGLAELERNMHQHVHKENNVLFPKALAIA